MPKLSCDVTTCGYNTQNLCSKQGITIGGQQAVSYSATECESFTESSGAFTSSSASASLNSSISCEASNCSYNEAGMCGAEVVSVGGGLASSASETKCATFVPKL